MARFSAQETIQVVNVDVAVERQRILREKMRELFKAVSKKSRVSRELVYTINQTNATLDQVVRANPHADVLFTAFNYDAGSSDEYKQEVLVDAPDQEGAVAPELRYPAIAELKRLTGRGYFRHRKLVLVGDVYEKIAQALKSHLDVQATVFADSEHTEVGPPISIPSVERLTREANGGEPELVPVGHIDSLLIGGIPFSAVINMPEVNNRFVLNDGTLLDTTRKLLTMEGVKEIMMREAQQEEQMTYVRGKRVFILLDEDLEYVIHERLVFDKMQRITRHHTLDAALRALAEGGSQNLVEYFEKEGYDLVFDSFTPEDRDRLLVTVLGNRTASQLAREVKSQKDALTAVEEPDAKEIFAATPEPLVNRTLQGLQEASFEKFLALVPPKIRQNVIMAFLAQPEQVAGLWGGLDEANRREVLTAQGARLLATLYLTDSEGFRGAFPAITFEFAANYDSSGLAGLSEDEQHATYELILQGLEGARPPQGIIAHQMAEPAIAALVGEYVRRQPEEFFNRLNPVVRKELWNVVGQQNRARILDTLHFLDKVEILAGNREAALRLLFMDEGFEATLREPAHQEAAGRLLLLLKKHNQTESKTALLRRILNDSNWLTARLENVPRFFGLPESGKALALMREQVDQEADFTFESLICSRADYERLKELEPLKDAVVTLVDDLVDASLFETFSKGSVSREEYEGMSATVEEDIAALQRQIAEKDGDDPVGVYLVESMQMLHHMTNQAYAGRLDAAAVGQLDERQALRERMINGLRSHLAKVADFLEKAAEQQSLLDDKLAKAGPMSERQVAATQAARQQADQAEAALQQVLATEQKLLNDKKQVALAQKHLSLEFFDLVRPLVLEKVGGIGSLLRGLLRPFGLFAGDAVALDRRIIFKFTDTEIQEILRYNIVFCSHDEVLKGFILTCLRIDNLQDSLFTLSTLQTLPPSSIDLLFHGPDHVAEEFRGLVPARRVVAFADASFHDRLVANERRKAVTKGGMVKLARDKAARQTEYQQAAQAAEAAQARLAQVESALNTLREERDALMAKIKGQQERQHHFQGELELLETRMAEVDGVFDQIKGDIGTALEGGDAVATLGEGTGQLTGRLGEQLVALNAKLARVMYVKGVKDAGEHISKSAQQAILQRIQESEAFDFTKEKPRKLVIAEDGSVSAGNLKRVFLQAALAFFKLNDQAVEEISLNRLEQRVDDAEGDAMPFLAVMADAGEDQFAHLRQVVKKVAARMPATYLMVFAPVGEIWNLEPESESFKNIRAIKESGALVNTAIGDYESPARILQLLAAKSSGPIGPTANPLGA